MSKDTNKLPWIFLLALTFVVTFWGFVTPMFEFPDEQVHLETVEYVADHGRVPSDLENDVTLEMANTQKLLGTFRDDYGNNKYTYHPDYHVEYTDTIIGKYESEIKLLNNSVDRSSYVKSEGARYPIAYYLYASWWRNLAKGSNLITRSFVVRLSAIPIAFLIALFSYKLGLLVFGKKKLAYVLASIVLLQPMFSFVTASTNSDTLHNLLFLILIYYCLAIIQSGLSVSRLIYVSGVALLDLVTKPQGYLTFPLIGLALLLALIRGRQWRQLIMASTLICIGLFLTRHIWLSYFNPDNPRDASFIEYLRFSGNKLLAQNVVWYWGVFKWLGVVLPPIYWRVANRVVLLSGFGLLVYCFRLIAKKRLVADPYPVLFLLISAFIYALAIFSADWTYVKWHGFSLGIQARYFFPTIICHLTLLMVGILSFGYNRISRYLLRASIFILFIWLQLGGIWRLITSYYATSSLKTFITQVSQYKPDYLKGDWWYLWIGLYLLSVIYLISREVRTVTSKSLAK